MPDDVLSPVGVDTFHTLRGADDEPETVPAVESLPMFIPDSTEAPAEVPPADPAPEQSQEG